MDISNDFTFFNRKIDGLYDGIQQMNYQNSLLIESFLTSMKELLEINRQTSNLNSINNTNFSSNMSTLPFNQYSNNNSLMNNGNLNSNNSSNNNDFLNNNIYGPSKFQHTNTTNSNCIINPNESIQNLPSYKSNIGESYKKNKSKSVEKRPNKNKQKQNKYLSNQYDLDEGNLNHTILALLVKLMEEVKAENLNDMLNKIEELIEKHNATAQYFSLIKNMSKLFLKLSDVQDQNNYQVIEAKLLWKWVTGLVTKLTEIHNDKETVNKELSQYKKNYEEMKDYKNFCLDSMKEFGVNNLEDLKKEINKSKEIFSNRKNESCNSSANDYQNKMEKVKNNEELNIESNRVLNNNPIKTNSPNSNNNNNKSISQNYNNEAKIINKQGEENTLNDENCSNKPNLLSQNKIVGKEDNNEEKNINDGNSQNEI